MPTISNLIMLPIHTTLMHQTDEYNGPDFQSHTTLINKEMTDDVQKRN